MITLLLSWKGRTYLGSKTDAYHRRGINILDFRPDRSDVGLFAFLETTILVEPTGRYQKPKPVVVAMIES